MKTKQNQASFNKILDFLSSIGLEIISKSSTEIRLACPFCQQNKDNPAFSIYPDFHCFCHACQKRGSIFDLLQKGGKTETQIKIELDMKLGKASRQALDTDTERINQAKQVYDLAFDIDKKRLGGWLKNRGFSKTQIYDCLERIDFKSQGWLKYREYNGEKALIVPIFCPVSGLVGIERINIEKKLGEKNSSTWNKKALGKKNGFFFLPAKDSKKTIITESLANAFVNALLGFNSLVTFGIGNTKQLPLAIERLQKQGHDVYYFPDSLGVSPDDHQAKNFMGVLKSSLGLLGVLWPLDVKKNYDVNDLFFDTFKDKEKSYQEKENDFKSTFNGLLDAAFTYESYFDSKKRLKETENIKAINLLPATSTRKISLMEAFKDKAKTKIIHASTGIGKTTTACLYAAELVKKGEKITFFCSTLTEAEQVMAILKGLVPNEIIDLVVSKTLCFEDGSQETGKSKRAIGQVAITTYAYLGFKGETNQAYSIAKGLIENRIVICDEAQELWHKMQVAYPLANNYFRLNDGEKTTFKEWSKCPKTARKGNCKGCRLSFSRDSAMGNPKMRQFAKTVSEKGFDETMPGHIIFHGCLDAKNYTHILASLAFMSLQEQEKQESDLEELYIEKNCSYGEWIDALLKWTDNPHLRIEFATVKSQDEIRLLDRKEIEKLDETGISYPVQACSVPFLSGRSLLHLFQLLKAKQLTFMSATIPGGLIAKVKDLAENEIKIFHIEEIPFVFDLTFLKTAKRLSLEKQAKVVEGLPNENIFVCTARKSEAEPLYEKLRRLGDVALFFRKDWEQVEESRQGGLAGLEVSKGQLLNAEIKKIITYSRSAITRGANFPKVCFAMIDCNQFLPLSALDKINKLLTKEEIKMLLIAEIRENLTQILGRFLRSEIKREAGKTIADKRKIVVLLHGLPEAVQDFSIDEKLLASCIEYKNNSFLSVIPRLEIESILEAVRLSRQGLPFADRKEKDHNFVFQKAIEKGLDGIDSGERCLLSPDDLSKLAKAREKAKEKAKDDNIEGKLKALKLEGKSWTCVYRALNVGRFSKIEKSRLKSLWKKL
jgi:hypothetical protein